MKFRLGLTLLMIAAWLLMPLQVFAISDPDTIEFSDPAKASQYKVFYNVAEDGDFLLIAEGYVIYNTIPTDYTADQAFLFELLNAAGTDTLAATTLKDFGDRPISIYLSAADATTLGLVVGTAYQIRITGNPLILASTSGNTVTKTLSAGSYVDQSLSTDDNNLLKAFVLKMAQNIEAHDDPLVDYTITIQGSQYLSTELNPSTYSSSSSTSSSSPYTANVVDNTTTYSSTTSNTTTTSLLVSSDELYAGWSGADIFLKGIPNLDALCPTLFQAGSESMRADAPEHTGTYALTLTASQKWGATTANGLTNIGVWLGLNQAMAGSVVLFVFAIGLSAYLYKRLESGIVVLMAMSATPFIGAYLGLMPLALAFILVIFIVTLLGYFFFSRGAL